MLHSDSVSRIKNLNEYEYEQSKSYQKCEKSSQVVYVLRLTIILSHHSSLSQLASLHYFLSCRSQKIDSSSHLSMMLPISSIVLQPRGSVEVRREDMACEGECPSSPSRLPRFNRIQNFLHFHFLLMEAREVGERSVGA